MAALWEADVTVLRMNYTLPGCLHVARVASLGATFLPVLAYCSRSHWGWSP